MFNFYSEIGLSFRISGVLRTMVSFGIMLNTNFIEDNAFFYIDDNSVISKFTMFVRVGFSFGLLYAAANRILYLYRFF